MNTGKTDYTYPSTPVATLPQTLGQDFLASDNLSGLQTDATLPQTLGQNLLTGNTLLDSLSGVNLSSQNPDQVKMVLEWAFDFMTNFIQRCIEYLVGNNAAPEEEEAEAEEEADISRNGRGAYGDPHFELTGTGGIKIKFDHKGKDNHRYHLFSGDKIRIEGTYVQHKDPNNPQIIGNLDIWIGSDIITVSKDGTVARNGTKLAKGVHKLPGGATIEINDQGLKITPQDGTGTIDILTQKDGLRIDPSGLFTGLDGIIGTAIRLNRKLSNDECNGFEVSRPS